MDTQRIIAIIVIIAVVGVIGVLEIVKPKHAGVAPAEEVILDKNARTAQKALQYQPAKEITTPDGFINYPKAGVDQNEPFTLQDFIGKKVILVEFWTYSCINCQRVIPYLNEWYKEYEDDGLVIVGIHTPEFDFEKDFGNVKRAVEKYGITWPVVLDNDYSTWTAYMNRYWPRKYLIDIDGYVVYDHIGEGGYDETEQEIVKLLNERKQVLGEAGTVMVKGGEPDDMQLIDSEKIGTPETYLGSARIQYLINLPNRSCLEGSCTYSFSNLEDFQGYELMGAWKLSNETANLESDTGAIRIAFTASKVNLVAGSDAPVRAKVLVDGVPVTSTNAGSDVKDGIVTFSEHDLYNLVDLHGDYGSHVLEIQFLDAGVAAFAFTFG